METLHISPDGTKPNTSKAINALKIAKDGDIIIAEPGIYRGKDNMLGIIPVGVHIQGTPDAQCLFDGQFIDSTIITKERCTVTDIQACNSINGYVAGRASRTHFARCEFLQDPPPFWKEPMWTNTSIFSCNRSKGATAEEVAVWGWGRKMSSNLKSSEIHDKTMWYRYDMPATPGKAVSIVYSGTGSSSLKNSIISLGGTDDARVMEQGKNSVWMLAGDPMRIQIDALVELDTILVIDQSRSRLRPRAGVSFGSGTNNILNNIHVVVPSNSVPFLLGSGGNGLGRGVTRDCWASNNLDSIDRETWPQEGNHNVGIYRDAWPILPETMWKRIERSTDWSAWPKAVQP